MDKEQEFLSGIEDIPEIHEGGSSMIFEKASGQQVSRPAGADGTPGTGIPMGPLDGSPVGGGFSSHIDPMSVKTPRRKVANRPKPWAAGDDYDSFLGGGGVSSFNQNPSPKEIEKQAGPVDNRIREINDSPTGQGFVGQEVVKKRISAKDEEGGNTQNVGQTTNLYTGKEQTREFEEKLAELQVVSKEDGAKLYSYAEFSEHMIPNFEAYERYLQKRCYACADEVEQGVMCHECYAGGVKKAQVKKAEAHATAGPCQYDGEMVDMRYPTQWKGERPESTRWVCKVHYDEGVARGNTTLKEDLFSQYFPGETPPTKLGKKAAGWSNNPVVPTGKVKKEVEYDSPGYKEDIESPAMFFDNEHYREQNAAIANDPVGGPKEKPTLLRDQKKAPKPDKQTMERYAEEAPKEVVIKGRKYVLAETKEAGEAAIQKEIPLQRPPSNTKGMDSKYLSHSEIRQVDDEQGEQGDFVRTKGASWPKGAHVVRPSGDSASNMGVPQDSSTVSFSAPGMGLPVKGGNGPIPMSSSGIASAPFMNKKAEKEENGIKIGEKVTSSKFEGEGEVMEVIHGDDGSVVGAIVDACSSLWTVAAQFLKRGEEYSEVIEDPEDPTKKHEITDEDEATGIVETEEVTTREPKMWKKTQALDLGFDVSEEEMKRLENL
jgi:hypothetical protein